MHLVLQQESLVNPQLALRLFLLIAQSKIVRLCYAQDFTDLLVGVCCVEIHNSSRRLVIDTNGINIPFRGNLPPCNLQACSSSISCSQAT